MPLDNSFPKAVAFVVGLRSTHGTEAKAPIGTAFFASMPAAIPNSTHLYVVTARHVVACEQRGTWLRINLKTGGWEDVPIARWIHHPRADVAVAYVGKLDRFDILSVPLSMFADRLSVRPSLGDQVYFIGLLASSELAAANVPIVRSGTLGALYQADIGMRGL
jgi:hypothetical protein